MKNFFSLLAIVLSLPGAAVDKSVWDEFAQRYDETGARAKPGEIAYFATNCCANLNGFLRERLWRSRYTGWYWGDYERTVRVWEDYRLMQRTARPRERPSVDFASARGAANAYAGLGRLEEAVVICRQALDESPKMRPADRYELMMVAETLRLRGSATLPLEQAVADADRRVAGETKAEAKDRAERLEIVGAFANMANREDLVRALKKVRDALYAPRPTKRYTVKFSETPINGPDGWDGLAAKPEVGYLDRYYGGSVDTLVTDIATGDRGKGIGTGANGEIRPGELRIVADSWGLHFRLEYFQTNACDAAVGAEDCGTYEAYLGPGEGQPYNCALIYNARRLDMYNTTYSTRGHRQIAERLEAGKTRSGISFTKEGVCTYYAYSWDSFAEVLPKDKTVWDYEVVRWCRLRKQPAWNGIPSIHARSSWGKLVFDLPPEARAKILRRVLFAVRNDYRSEKENWTKYGIIAKLRDRILGDPEFYAAEVAPMVERLDAYDRELTAGLKDEELAAFADRALRTWRDFVFVVQQKHAVWKKAKVVAAAREAAFAPVAKKPRPAPRPALLKRLKDESCEVIGIVHWGPNTYTDREWGYGNENPTNIAPTAFSAQQIVEACRDGGIGGLVVVAKHHDGLCLWPTATTEHNVTKATNFKKDYVREMCRACSQARIKFGVYVSPWDRNNADYGTPKYVETFHRQIRELTGGAYGQIFEMWFDGANGGDGWYGGKKERRKIPDGYYRFDELFAFLREKQKDITIFNESEKADFRWPGNERGILDAGSRATGLSFRNSGRDYMSWCNTGVFEGTCFHPCEADFPLRRGWFYHEKERGSTKCAAYLMQRYLNTVGNGGTMNLGIAPTKEGRLDDEDVRALKGFQTIRTAFFANQVAEPGKPFNVIVMRENIEDGEQVDAWRVVADGETVVKGTAIGVKRIRVLAKPLAADSVSVYVDKSANGKAAVTLQRYYADPELVKAVLSAKADDRETDTARWMTTARK